MDATGLFVRQRVTLVALGASAAIHAGVIITVPFDVRGPVELEEASYSVRLEAGQSVSAELAPAPARPASRRAKRRPSPPKPDEAIAQLPPPPAESESVSVEARSEGDLLQPLDPVPELVALAGPAAPIAALEPPRFPTGALPSKLSISYALTSPFADGRAEYTWTRKGEIYEIFGFAEAVGFFAVFLEGQIQQESRGTVTAEGLRPERFSERRPRVPEEGLTFDWVNRSMTFSRNDALREGRLTDNTVDWLSMIFQLAHVPPNGESVELRVFTQRRLYNFSLRVLGIEEVEIPLGKVPALHLRHLGRTEGENVDVWLGIEQHYLPVKLRYPVARNRFHVEQVATSISAR